MRKRGEVTQLTIHELAAVFPKPIWDRFVTTGVYSYSQSTFFGFDEDPNVRRFLLAFAAEVMHENGVDPADPNTWDNIRKNPSFAAFGWVRTLGTPAQFVAAVCPCRYVMTAAFYARMLLDKGLVDTNGLLVDPLTRESGEVNAVLACLCQRVQLYNMKLAFPGAEEKSFGHMDCDPRRVSLGGSGGGPK